MAQIVNTNLMSLNSQRHLNHTNLKLATAVERLTSGFRINSAKDDAAGLAIADRMTTQVRGMNVAIRNANDAISLSQVAEGALSNVGDALQRMRELAVQSANSTNGSSDRKALQNEFAELQAEISRVIQSADFNGKKILDTDAGTLRFQVGANTGPTDGISIQTKFMSGTDSAGILAANAMVGVTTVTSANADAVTVDSGAFIGSDATSAKILSTIDNIGKALEKVNTMRATFGAVQNRFEGVIQQLQVGVENQSASRSRITDADFAAETAELTRTQILQQGGIAMLGQANQAPQGILRLLG